MPPKSAKDDFDAAEEIAIKALGFLAAEPERLGRFLSVTGLGPQNLRGAARQPAFLAQILAYLGSDEALLMTFAEQAGLTPHSVSRASEKLAGTPAPGSL